MYSKFSQIVRAFMSLELYDYPAQIEILHTMFAEPFTRDDAIPVIIGLACKLRAQNQIELLRRLCDGVGLSIVENSIYTQETAHVFQNNYKQIAQQLLVDYKAYAKFKHKIPKELVVKFHNCVYQGISIRRILNIVYKILSDNDALELLLSDLRDNIDTCTTGFITRVLNCILPFTDYKINSFEYEREKLFNKFNSVLIASGNTVNFVDALAVYINQESCYKTMEPNFILVALEHYTGRQWGIVNGVFYPSLTDSL